MQALRELDETWDEAPGDFENLPDGDDPARYAAHFARLRAGMFAASQALRSLHVRPSGGNPRLWAVIARESARASFDVLGSDGVIAAVRAALVPLVYQGRGVTR